MKTNFYWIKGPWKGRLAILPRPRGGDWLEEEVNSWKKAGVDTVVSALTPEETGELDLANEESLCRSAGIRFVPFPIEDRSVPDSMMRTRDLAESLRRISQARRVGRHPLPAGYRSQHLWLRAFSSWKTSILGRRLSGFIRLANVRCRIPLNKESGSCGLPKKRANLLVKAHDSAGNESAR